MRIAIVNDSALAVEAMRRAIKASARHEVAWLARDGHEAVAACARDIPDLVLMDLMMPQMDGVEATRRIMAETPCVILIVTANVNGRAGKVFEALGAGALDAVSTPTLGEPNGANAFLSKLQTLNRLIGGEESTPSKRGSRIKRQSEERLVVIGASAGGPAALATILEHLPRDFPGAIVVAQHVDAQFASAMAEWLNERSALPVRLAREDERPQPGHVLLAGKDAHLVFGNSGRLAYKSEPADCSYRPSIDLFFQSVIRHWKGKATAVLLTGMGHDGARGMKALRESGVVLTIAQDEETSVVFGMPRAAIKLGAATRVLPLPQIATALIDFVER